MMRIGLMLFYVLCFGGIVAQTDTSFGLMPRVNFSYKINSIHSLVSSVESRHSAYDSREMIGVRHKYILTDYSLFYSRKLARRQSLNMGYMLRSRSDQFFHRVSLHFNTAQRIARGRIGHRIASDITFEPDSEIVSRLRYRIVMERAMSGDQIDQGEWYLKVGAETLYSFMSGQDDLEFRLIPMMGYELNPQNKIEIGLDIRLSKFINNTATLNHWTRLSWYYRI